jgi:hypothetical protein
MLPENVEYLTDFEIESQPSYTYKLDAERNRIIGKTDGLDAVKQAIYKILNTERYEYIIYDWNYGVELVELIGGQKSYVIPELERRITEALLQDDRISAVSDFVFDTKGKKYTVSFEATTIEGVVDIEEWEVDI